MPLYEYVCPDCDTRFERLRPLLKMDDPAGCPQGHAAGRRVLSMFAALTKDSTGEAGSIAGG
ncbi:MAG: FmdB family zinc ribbon protein, partial [bacterium]